jgi:hypothetical protein
MQSTHKQQQPSLAAAAMMQRHAPSKNAKCMAKDHYILMGKHT